MLFREKRLEDAKKTFASLQTKIQEKKNAVALWRELQRIDKKWGLDFSNKVNQKELLNDGITFHSLSAGVPEK
jgi:hypothetical protein